MRRSFFLRGVQSVVKIVRRGAICGNCDVDAVEVQLRADNPLLPPILTGALNGPPRESGHLDRFVVR